jgi:hypothetical protein
LCSSVFCFPTWTVGIFHTAYLVLPMYWSDLPLFDLSLSSCSLPNYTLLNFRRHYLWMLCKVICGSFHSGLIAVF